MMFNRGYIPPEESPVAGTMTYTFTLTDATADAFGEALRGEFFDQRDGFGCYSSFDLNADVEPLEPLDWDEDGALGEAVTWRRARKVVQGTPIEMRYYWDGDGTLLFLGPGFALENDDCKKCFHWVLRKT